VVSGADGVEAVVGAHVTNCVHPERPTEPAVEPAAFLAANSGVTPETIAATVEDDERHSA
jgi:hypothetical protein